MILFIEQVHVDEQVSIQSHRKADFSLALRDKPVAIHKLNPQTLFEHENPKVKLMCDLNKIYVANREFSYEEIRRQCYERKFPTPSSSSVTPALPAAKTPALRVRTPVLKARTPPASCADGAKQHAAFNPNEHLKANERLHCDVDLIFSDGNESSFEEVRARFYASRIFQKVEEPSPVAPAPRVQVLAVAAQVEAPVVLKSIESTAPPAAIKQVATTREIAVQTDLFGLDYDIQFVPRKPHL